MTREDRELPLGATIEEIQDELHQRMAATMREIRDEPRRTLRDQFAMAALQSLALPVGDPCATEDRHHFWPADFYRNAGLTAYAVADAMLAAREPAPAAPPCLRHCEDDPVLHGGDNRCGCPCHG